MIPTRLMEIFYVWRSSPTQKEEEYFQQMECLKIFLEGSYVFKSLLNEKAGKQLELALANKGYPHDPSIFLQLYEEIVSELFHEVESLLLSNKQKIILDPAFKNTATEITKIIPDFILFNKKMEELIKGVIGADELLPLAVKLFLHSDDLHFIRKIVLHPLLKNPGFGEENYYYTMALSALYACFLPQT